MMMEKKSEKNNTSFKLHRIDESINLIVIDSSFQSVTIIDELNGNERKLRRTQKFGLQLT